MQKLLRIALFSLLAFVVAAGVSVAPVQAQEVIVDNDGNGDVLEIGAGLSQLDGEVGSDGAGTLVIDAGDYTVDEGTINFPGAGNDNLANVTVEVREDGGRSDVLVEGVEVNDSDLSVSVTSTNGSERLEVESVNGITLAGGTLNIESDGEILAQDGVTVTRESGGQFAAGSEALSTAGDFALTYNTSGDDLEAGAETADGSLGDNLTVNGNGSVTFPGDLIEANNLALNNEASATFEGDFTSATGTSVGPNNGLSVGGQLTVGGSINATGDVTSTSTTIGADAPIVAGDGALLNLGDVTFTETLSGGSPVFDLRATSGTGTPGTPEEVIVGTVTATIDETTSDLTGPDGSLVEGGGVFDADEFDIQAEIASGISGDSEVAVEFLANDPGGSAATEFKLGDVSLGSATDDDDNTLNVVADLNAAVDDEADTQEITAGGSDFRAVNAGVGDITLDSGSDEILITQSFTTGGTLTAASDVRYSADFSSQTADNSSGEVVVESGNTLTVEATDDSDDGQTVLTNSEGDNAGISGDGTFAVETGETSGGNPISVTIDGEGHDFPTFEHTGSGELDVAVTTSASPISISGELTAEASTDFVNGGFAPTDLSASSVSASADVTFNGETFTASDVTASSGTVTFNGFNTTAADVVDIDLENLTTSGGTVEFPDDVSSRVQVSGTLTAESGAVNTRSAGVTVGNADIQENGTLDISDQTGSNATQLEILGNLTRSEDASPGLVTSTGSEILFNGQDAAQFDSGAQFIINGDVTVDKVDSELELLSPVRVNGTLAINDTDNEFADDPQLTLSSNLIFGVTDDAQDNVDSQPGGLVLDGTLATNEGNRVIFRETSEDNYNISGAGQLRNVTVRTNGPEIFVGDDPDDNTDDIADIQFTGTVDLQSGGIAINGVDSDNTSDLSPSGEDAEVRRNLANAGNTQITSNANGSFNGDEAQYDLAYGGDTSEFESTQDEITEFVRDLTIESGTLVSLQDAVELSGALTLNGQVLDGDGSASVTLAGDNVEHSIVGAATDTDADGNDAAGEITVEVAGENAEIVGDASDANDENGSELVNLTADAAGVGVTDIQQITGDLTVNEDAGLTLALGAADADGVSDTDQRVGGSVTLDGDLTLGADAVVQNGVTANAGEIDFASSDLVVTGGDFTAEEPVTYSASSAESADERGELVLDGGSSVATNDDGSTDATPAAIPNVRVEANGTSLGSNVGVSSWLVVNAGDDRSVKTPGVELDGNALSASGNVVLNGETSSNGGTPIAVGGSGTFDVSDASIEVQSGDNDAGNLGSSPDQGVSTLTISGGSEVAVTSTGDDPRTLDVQGTLDVATDAGGAFNVQGNTVKVSGASFAVSGSDVGESASVTSSGGYLAFDNSGLSTSLARGVEIDRLKVLENAGLTDGDEQTFTVNDELWLDAQFDANTDTAADVLAVADGVTIRRTSGYTSNDALTETPDFGGEVSLVYNGDGSEITSGYEVPSASADATILDIEVNDDVEFRRVEDGVADGNVVVTDIFDLKEGTVTHGIDNDAGSRQIEIEDGGVFAQQNGSLSSGSDAQSIAASDYTLRYYPDDGNAETSDQEFLEGGTVSTLEFIDGPADEPSDNLELHEDREVGALTVNRAGDSELDLTSDGTERTLTVTGSTDLTAGTVDDGTLQSEGDVTITGGDVSGATLAFAGDSDQSFTIDSDKDVGEVELNQTTSGNEVPSVTASGGNIVVGDDDASVETVLTLQNGLLQVEGDNALDLGEDTFTRDLAEGDTSHVVGAVTRRVGNFNEVAEYPVGSANATYRPFGFIFPFGVTQETDITVAHVDENPGETGGLPLTDNENVTVGENYPDYYWSVETSQRLAISDAYEAFAQTEGLDLENQSVSDYRLIQRAEAGDSWGLVGNGSDYSNETINATDGRADISTVGATADLSQTGRRYTVGVPGGAAAFNIAGSVNYPTVQDGSIVDGRALGGVEVRAVSSNDTLTTTTNSDGSFTITDVSNGDYTVEANVTSAPSNVETPDALRTVRGFTGIDPFLSDFQREVADVNNDGTANSSDALQIARFDIEAIDSFQAGSWYSSQPTVTVDGGNQTGVTVRAAEYGDVRLDGGESSSSSSTVATASSQSAAAAASTSELRSVEMGSGTFEVPVRVDGSATVGAYSLTLEVPTDKASFEGVATSDDNVMTNVEDGTVKISWFDQAGDQPIELSDGAELVTLQFSAAEEIDEGTTFRPEITGGALSGADATPVTSASVQMAGVQIGSTAPDKFALNGNAPNPVSAGQTRILMDMPERAEVTVEVYNTLGQQVMTTRSEVAAGSDQGIRIDGSRFSSGQYFYRVNAELSDRTVQETGRMTVVK